MKFALPVEPRQRHNLAKCSIIYRWTIKKGEVYYALLSHPGAEVTELYPPKRLTVGTQIASTLHAGFVNKHCDR